METMVTFRQDLDELILLESAQTNYARVILVHRRILASKFSDWDHINQHFFQTTGDLNLKVLVSGHRQH